MQKITHYGFTLIEIMIVIFIIGVMSAVAVLNLNGATYSRYISKANKVAATLNLLADEAVYTDNVIACDINSNGFTCQTYKNGEWDNLDIRKITSWEWPKEIRIETVLMDGNPIKEAQDIRFYPAGELPIMSFQITDGVYHNWIDGDLNGNFKVSN